MTAPTAPCAQNISTAMLSAWRDDGLPAAEAQTLAAHTPSCAACQAHLADYDAVARALLAQRELDPADRILAGVRSGAVRQRRVRSRARIWGGLGALTSAAALVLLFVYAFGHAQGNVAPHLSYTTFHLPDPSYTVADLVPARDGSAWISEVQIVQNTQGSGTTQGHAKIGHISEAGQITEYPLPDTDNLEVQGIAGGSVLGAALTVGPDGNIWFVKVAGGLVHTALPQQKIVKLTPDGTMTDYELPGPSSIVVQPSVTTPLLAGPDGNLWFGLTLVTHAGQTPADTATAMTLARITPAGTITTFTLPSPYEQKSSIYELIAGPDGNLWFTIQLFNADSNAASGLIARATPTGAISTFTLQGANDAVLNLVAGPDGNGWFVDSPSGVANASSAIGRITPSGQITQFSTNPTAFSTILELTPARDGNLYAVGLGPACASPCQQFKSSILRITPAGQISAYSLPTWNNVILAYTAATPDGSVYFAELTGTTQAGTNRIARFAPNGHISEYAVPTSGGGTLTLVAGAGNTLWLTVAPEPGKTGPSTILHITLPAS